MNGGVHVIDVHGQAHVDQLECNPATKRGYRAVEQLPPIETCAICWPIYMPLVLDLALTMTILHSHEISLFTDNTIRTLISACAPYLNSNPRFVPNASVREQSNELKGES